MQKRFIALVSLGVLTILAVSLVSAFWPFDSEITGNVVLGSSSYCTTIEKCSYGQGDCDDPRKGEESQCITGLVCTHNIGRNFNFSKTTDICLCPEGQIWDGDSCNNISPSCEPIIKEEAIIGVKNEKGEEFKNTCGSGRTRLNYTDYSCFGSQVASETTACETRCDDSAGCVGACSETDEENNKDIGGVVTLDGVQYPDECSGTTRVIQYRCFEGRKKVVRVGTGDSNSVSCGANKRCVSDFVNGARCVDVASVDRIELLENEINSLKVALCNKDNTYSFCASVITADDLSP